MGINPDTGKFCTHVDVWDSIQNNDYFSVEAMWDVFNQMFFSLQLQFYKTQELESPKYQILKRTANYEVRKYAPFRVVETSGDKLAGSAGLRDPKRDTIDLRKVEGGIAAVLKFSGKPTEEIVQDKAKELRSSLIKDSLKRSNDCFLGRYNDPGRTWNPIMRNEVLIWLEEFSLE